MATVWGTGPLLFQYHKAPVYKASSIKKWFSKFGVEARTSTSFTIFGMNWNAVCEAALVKYVPIHLFLCTFSVCAPLTRQKCWQMLHIYITFSIFQHFFYSLIDTLLIMSSCCLHTIHHVVYQEPLWMGTFASRLLEVGWFPRVTVIYIGSVYLPWLWCYKQALKTVNNITVYTWQPGWFHCSRATHVDILFVKLLYFGVPFTLYLSSHAGAYPHMPTDVDIYTHTHTHTHTHTYTHIHTHTHTHTHTIHTRGGSWSWPRTHLSLWQAGLPFSGLVAWFLHGGWVSPCLCCLVTVRSRLWFMQIGRKGLVGQPQYVVRLSLGQCTKTS